MERLEGKTAVVIGGTHGMGRATGEALVARGAKVILTGRNASHVERLRAELNGRATVVQSDVSRLPDIDGLVGTVREVLGEVDAVFVFAGVAQLEPFAEVTEASFDRQFEVNTRGAFFAVQRLAPLVRDGGSITLTTVTPSTASPGMSVYLATKAAVRAFARGFAAEMLERRVRVNTLAPGFIDTPTLGVAGLTADARAALAELGDQVTPMKRHGAPLEVARAALFLAFDATYSTGIELPVDGGLSTVDAPMA